MCEGLEGIRLMGWISGAYVLSGVHQCSYSGTIALIETTWILGMAWEILTLCLATWTAVKHFRESTGRVGDCFTILMKTHVFYFSR
jgi:hypothetical protein